MKHEGKDLAPATKRVHALGISQSGRFLRHFLLEGFNFDDEGTRAIDGMFIHVAGAGIGSFNHRFAQPSRDAQPTTALFYPTDLFPFTDAPQTELESGKRAGLLDRANANNAVGKIFYTNTFYGYWSCRFAHSHVARWEALATTRSSAHYLHRPEPARSENRDA